MAEIKKSSNDWLSISAESGLAIGAQMKIQNKSGGSLLLLESPTKPDITNFDGEIITNIHGSEPSKIALDGSQEVWVRSVDPVGAIINLHVQLFSVVF